MFLLFEGVLYFMFLASFTYNSIQRLTAAVLYFPDCEGDECNRGRASSASPPLSSSVVKSLQPSQDFLEQFAQVSSPNSGDRKHRDASAVLPFIGLTGSKFTPEPTQTLENEATV